VSILYEPSFTESGLKRYNVIYADCPWSFNNKKTGGSMKSGAESVYPVMSFVDLCLLPVREVAAEDSLLAMWWVASQPEEALEVMRAWGFRLVTMTGFVWVKSTKFGKPYFGMGFQTRAGSEVCSLGVRGDIDVEVEDQGAEFCLLAKRGGFKRRSGSVRSVVNAPVGAHSEKPEEVRSRLMQLTGPVPSLEMFARVKTPGWDVFGNEVQDSIDLFKYPRRTTRLDVFGSD
jgi:N6-adenosine-specific RNA methylase IME4